MVRDIIAGLFSSYDPDNVRSVKILKSYKFDFKFGLDIKIHLIDKIEFDIDTDSDSDFI